MSAFRRGIWLIALTFFASGCAGYRPASLPGFEMSDEVGGSETIVEVGSKVKVEKNTGVIVSGKVLRISDEFLVLEISGSNGLTEYQVEFNEISSLEVKKGSSSIPIILVGVVLVVVVVAVVASATSQKATEATLQSFE